MEGGKDSLQPILSYRSGGRSLPLGIHTYIKDNGTNLNLVTRNKSEVYEYVLDSPLAFQEGDILSYFQPIRNRSEILEDSERQHVPQN